MTDLSVLAGRRVLVTGDTGFKGSWSTVWLRALGAEVTGLALGVPTVPSMFELLDLGARVRHLDTDVRDVDAVRRAVRAARPEVVLHLAAQPLVRYSYDHPAETFETNLMGTVNVLDAVVDTASCRTIVMITSDKCYENKEREKGYRETDELGGFDELLPVCEDYDLWLRMSLKYPIAYLDEKLIIKRGGHADQLSKKYWVHGVLCWRPQVANTKPHNHPLFKNCLQCLAHLRYLAFGHHA